MAEAPFNKTLAVSIASIGALLIIALTAGVFSAPAATFDAINSLSAKTTLVYAGSAFIAWTGTVLFRLLYFPRPRRLLIVGFYVTLFLGALMLSSTVGLIAIEATIPVAVGQITFGRTLSEVSPAVVLVVTVVGLLLFSREYRILAAHEAQYGPLM